MLGVEAWTGRVHMQQHGECMWRAVPLGSSGVDCEALRQCDTLELGECYLDGMNCLRHFMAVAAVASTWKLTPNRGGDVQAFRALAGHLTSTGSVGSIQFGDGMWSCLLVPVPLFCCALDSMPNVSLEVAAPIVSSTPGSTALLVGMVFPSTAAPDSTKVTPLRVREAFRNAQDLGVVKRDINVLQALVCLHAADATWRDAHWTDGVAFSQPRPSE